MKTKTFLIVILLALMMPVGAWAETVQYTDPTSGIMYNIRINSDNTPEAAVVTGWTNPKSTSHSLPLSGSVSLTIPASLTSNSTTIPIIGVESVSFKGEGNGNNYLKSVVVGENVTTIKDNAFANCAYLKNVTITTTVESIGSNAFLYCGTANGNTDYVTIIIEKGSRTNVYQNLLSAQSYVKNIVVKSGITTISVSAFGNMQRLENVTLPSSLKTIGESAFQSNRALTSIGIPEGVQTIHQYAFADCSALSSVTLPSTLKTIYAYAFQNCAALTEVDIPRSVTTLGDRAFDCANLTQVKVNWYTPLQITGDADPFPQKATEDHSLIAPFALDQYYVNDAYWGQFKSIEPTPTYVNDTGLVYGWVGDGTTHVKVVGWQGWTNPTSVLIEPKLYVGDPQNNENLVFDVTEIGDEALKDCTLLQDITIPASVTKIGESAFQGSGLYSITLNEGLRQIGLNAFNGCSSLQTVNVPSSVTGIGAGAFSTCGALQTATIQAQITRLLNQTFQHCSSLTSVSLPSTLTEINYLAFFNCTSLPSIAIPENVNIIGSAAFRNCTSLKDVYFQGATPPDVDLEGQGDLFRNENGDGVIDHSTITLHVPFGATEAYRNHTYWSTFHILLPSEINIDFADAKVKDICVGIETGWDTNNDRELSLAEAAAVTDIGSYFNSDEITTFDEFRYFTGVTTIPSGAFNGCTALTSITFPESLTTIEMWAFQNCSALTNLVIPEGVTTIGWLAFRSYTGIVTLPSTLTSLDSSSFEAAAGAKVSWPEPPAALAQDFYSAFGSTSNKLLYVPIGSYDIYEDTPTWWAFDTREYGNITFVDANVKVLCLSWDSDGDGELSAEEALEVTSFGNIFKGNTNITSFNELKNFRSLTEIPAEAFQGCSALTSIVLPKSITKIGTKAFMQTGLTAIDIPEKVTEIAMGAFDGCSSLATVNLSSYGIETIGEYAFGNDPLLNRIVIPGSVTQMDDAFKFYPSGTGNLTYVTAYFAEPIAITENTFPNRANATLFVPEDFIENYKSADYWKEFKNIISKIEFNDPKVKAICVDPARGWDANGDGELTKDEAAAVTTLGTAFTGNTEIETFGELKYFTGLNYNNAVPALTGGDSEHGAFDGCTNLRYVEMPANIEQIMNFSFRGCTSLANVNIPSGVHTILDDAFQGCTALSYASMPQALEHIGAHAFDGCSSLRWMAFPNQVITYGDQAFNGCSSLTQVTVNSSVPGVIDGDPFPTRGNITLTVPAHAAATYQANDYWKWFKNFQEQEPNWTGEFTDANGDVYQYETGYYAQLKRHAESSSRTKFTVLSEITVDGTAYPVKSIGVNAINASYLTTLTIPASITAVKRDAFSCQPTADGMTLKTIIMQGSVPPTAERFQAWEDDLASYNVQMEVQQHMNPGLEFTRLSLKDITLMVPAGAKTAYEADNTWNRFTVEEVTPGNGNADGIGGIDINDVLAVIDYILGKTVPETFDPAAADINGDGDITIADAAAVVNAILNQ